MTPDDDTPDAERGPSAGQARTDGRYVSYETDDGGYVIRDESTPDAWIRSDTVVDLSGDD